MQLLGKVRCLWKCFEFWVTFYCFECHSFNCLVLLFIFDFCVNSYSVSSCHRAGYQTFFFRNLMCGNRITFDLKISRKLWKNRNLLKQLLIYLTSWWLEYFGVLRCKKNDWNKVLYNLCLHWQIQFLFTCRYFFKWFHSRFSSHLVEYFKELRIPKLKKRIARFSGHFL